MFYKVWVILKTWNLMESLAVGTEHTCCVCVQWCGPLAEEWAVERRGGGFHFAGRGKVRACGWPVCLLVVLFVWNDREAKIRSCLLWLWFLQTWVTASSVDLACVHTTALNFTISEVTGVSALGSSSHEWYRPLSWLFVTSGKASFADFSLVVSSLEHIRLGDKPVPKLLQDGLHWILACLGNLPPQASAKNK